MLKEVLWFVKIGADRYGASCKRGKTVIPAHPGSWSGVGAGVTIRRYIDDFCNKALAGVKGISNNLDAR